MGKPAARLTDLHICPMWSGPVPHVGGPISGPCAPTVLTGGLPQAKLTDLAVCAGGPDVLTMGSPTVLVNGMPAVRMGDLTAHGGTVAVGLPNVLIGEAGSGGAGGSGGMIQPGSGLSTVTSMLSAAGALISPAQQAAAYKAAAKANAAFCERC
jgi:uncharacterized Zn-binding protein involved in type VI secretion